MDMTVTIEPVASIEGIDEVLEIERASFTNPWTRDMYLAELDNAGLSFIFGARDERRHMIGFCSFWLVADEIHINNLAVLPAARRRGIASALLQRILAEGSRRGAVRATLEVRQSNEIARGLYERFGFSVTGVRRAYYTHPPEDALILWRDGLADDTA
jgi:[ribosomal protein S18]-alanine N-acetyltransferase